VQYPHPPGRSASWRGNSFFFDPLDVCWRKCKYHISELDGIIDKCSISLMPVGQERIKNGT
jgi:hypothetical protein